MLPAGFEPATCGLGIRCSILLSYESAWIQALLAKHHNRLAKDYSYATINRCLVLLSHALTVAVKDWQWIEAISAACLR